MKQSRFWFILQQDVDRPVGGVKQIYVVASIISSFGYHVTIVQGTSDFRPSWFPSSDLNFHTVGKNDFSFAELNPNIDIVVIPETFLPLLPRLSCQKVVIFNQNMHYLFGELFDLDPSFVMRAYSSPNIVGVLTVSSSDYAYALDSLPVPSDRIHRIVNAIDENIFSFSFASAKSIAFMPRKNAMHSRAVLELIMRQSWFQDSGWSFTPIHKKSLAEVSSILADSSIFLSFGYPEGFGLPLAEAIVSGCFVVGYDGIGGSEIAHLCKPLDVFTSVPFRDFHAYLNGVQHAIAAYESSNLLSLRSRLKAASRQVSQRYSTLSMVDSVKAFVDSIILL